ncbi:unnamed protein product [Amoebophrya sp. A120]|nr:unnamed protein product [Amoebophrya sp. A120]|eukprot:GSA120T00023695001.1
MTKVSDENLDPPEPFPWTEMDDDSQEQEVSQTEQEPTTAQNATVNAGTNGQRISVPEPATPSSTSKQDKKRQHRREIRKLARREKRSKVKYDAVEKVAALFQWHKTCHNTGSSDNEREERHGSDPLTSFLSQHGSIAQGFSNGQSNGDDLAMAMNHDQQQEQRPGMKNKTSNLASKPDLSLLPPHEREAHKLAVIREREAAKRKEPAPAEVIDSVRCRILEHFGFLCQPCEDQGSGVDTSRDATNRMISAQREEVDLVSAKFGNLSLSPASTRSGETEGTDENSMMMNINEEQMKRKNAENRIENNNPHTHTPYVPYDFLPQQHCSKQALQFVESFFIRGENYAQKFSAQEASLLEQLYKLNCDSETVIIDLGCGNATLVLLAGLIFNSFAVGVDRRTPHENCQGEFYFPKEKFPELKFKRLEQCVSTVLPDILKLLREINEAAAAEKLRPYRKVIILCKHLCGAGTDYCIRFMENLGRELALEDESTKDEHKNSMYLHGAVFASCCTHKISTDPEKRDLKFFTDYYDIVSSVAEEDTASASEDVGKKSESTSTKTSTNPSRTNKQHIFAQLCKWAAWRNTEQSVDSKLSTEHIKIAEVCDDLVQALRMEKLRTFFKSVSQIVYVPLSNSMQNRAIVCRTDSSEDLHERGVNTEDDVVLVATDDSRSDSLPEFATLLNACTDRYRAHLPVKLAAHDLYNVDDMM